MKDLFNKYLKTYSGKKLLTKHKLLEEGVWLVKGEDPNCDMGGAHVQPTLGMYEGTLEDAINWAVNEKGFWQWGSGGDLIKQRVINKSNETITFSSLKERLNLTEHEKQLIKDNINDL